jgi:hypothetical protein
MTSTNTPLSMQEQAAQEIRNASKTFFHPDSETPEVRRKAIVAEAIRLQERLSSTPFYANRAKKEGPKYWLSRCISYAGD